MKSYTRISEIGHLVETGVLTDATIEFAIPHTIAKINMFQRFIWVYDYGYSITEHINNRERVDEYMLTKVNEARYDIQEYIKREQRILAGCYWHPSTKVK